MKKNWQLLPEAPLSFFEEHKDFSAIVAQLLFNRGLQTKDQIEYFLKPETQEEN